MTGAVRDTAPSSCACGADVVWLPIDTGLMESALAELEAHFAAAGER
jgi:hypothetical protein